MTEEYNNNWSNKPVSITPTGFFGTTKDNIVEIENFMTEEEHKTLLDFITNNTMWDKTETKYNEDGVIIYESEYWKDRVATSGTLYAANPEIPKIIENLVNRLKPTIEKFFNVEATPTFPAMVKWLPGQFQHPHADKELHEGEHRGKPNDFPHYDLASLFYLNDDYEGGELYFPLQGVVIKPKARAAYFFPGDMNYIHGVTEIKSGIRYTCPFFWTITKHINE